MILIIILGALGLVLVFGIRVIYEWEQGLVFTLGRYTSTRKKGLTYILPIIQQMKKVDMRIRTLDVEPQECITKDSVTVNLDAIIYFKVIDSKKAIVNVEDFVEASFKFGQTALKDVTGKRDLDYLLQKKDEVGKEIKKIIQVPTDNFGVEVQNVEVKDVILPKDMKRAMAKEAEASREKKARIIKSEGEFEASKKFKQASENMSDNAMILRQLQTWQEIGSEQNSTMILVPSELVSNVKNLFNGKKPSH